MLFIQTGKGDTGTKQNGRALLCLAWIETASTGILFSKPHTEEPVQNCLLYIVHNQVSSTSSHTACVHKLQWVNPVDMQDPIW